MQCKPNCVALAQTHLERQALRTFLPLERETRVRGGSFVAHTRPYFPGYLFVAISGGSAPWRAINATRGVSRLVSFGNAPAYVPRSIMIDLLAHCDEDGILRSSDRLAVGEKVRLTAGPLAGFVGQIESVDGKQRVWLLLEAMGQQSRVSVKRSDMRRAG